MTSTPLRPLGGSFAWKLTGGGSRFIAYVAVFLLAANLLSREHYGEAQQVLAVVAVAAAFADFGLSGSMRRFLGQLAMTRPAVMRPFLLRTTAPATGLALLGGAVMFLAREPLARWFESPLLTALIWLAAPLTVFWVLNVLLSSVLDGLERFDLQAGTATLYALALGGGTAFFLLGNPDAAALVWAYLVSHVAVVLVMAVLVVWATSGSWRAGGESVPAPMAYGGWVFLATIGGLIVSRVNTLVIGAYHGADEVALYSVADRFFQIPLMGSFLLVGVIGPRASRLEAAGDRRGLQDLFRVSNGGIGLLFGAALAVIFLATPLIVSLMFSKYPDAVPLIRVLLPLGLLRTFGGIAAGGFLIACGHARAVAVVSVISMVLVVTGDLVFVPVHGSWGAIWVSVVVQGTAAMVGVVLVGKLLKIRFGMSLRGARELLLGSRGMKDEPENDDEETTA